MTVMYRQPDDPGFLETLLVLIVTFGLVDLDRQHDSTTPSSRYRREPDRTADRERE